MSNYWESYDIQVKYIQPKNLKIDDFFDGWYQGTKRGRLGEQFTIKNEEDENLLFPLAGTIRSLFETMNIQKWDFIRLIYKGEALIESGDWKGQKCHRWMIKRNPSQCGEDAYKRAMGYPVEETPSEEPVGESQFKDLF